MSLQSRQLRCVLVATLACSVASQSIEAAPPILVNLSPTFTEGLAYNGNDVMLGRREVAEEGVGFSQQYFCRRGDETRTLSPPPQFTNLDVYRVSDSGWLVGAASRAPHPDGNQIACLWDSTTGTPSVLPIPAPMRGARAFDISSDGQVVVGMVVGRDPPVIAPCLWRQSEDRQWTFDHLPTPQRHSPFLTSGHIAVSDDGRRVAASVAVNAAEHDASLLVNHLYEWVIDEQGHWRAKRLAPLAVHVANINNDGVVVGRVTRAGHRIAFAYLPNVGAVELEPLEGDVASELNDINNAGIAVGMSDDPPGPDGGPQAVVWQLGDERLTQLPLPAAFSFASGINDRQQITGWLIRAAEDQASDEPIVGFLHQHTFD